MYLAEVKVEINNLEKKIQELVDYMGKVCDRDADTTDKVFNNIMELMNKLQSHKLAYSRYCGNLNLEIGGTKVTLSEAKIILNTMEEKINVLEELIKYSNNSTMDIFSLIENKDKLYKEYISLHNALQSVEWSTKID